MTQATEVIAYAYYLSGVVGRQFATVTDTQTNDGFVWLNEILSELSINGALVPYLTHYAFTATQGVSIYEVPGLIDLTTMTFNLDTIRFEMRRDTVLNFFGTDRVDDVQSLPFHFYAERQVNMMKIYLYFVPSDTFTMKITGKFVLTPLVSVNDAMIYDPFYIKFIKYELANEICRNNRISLRPDISQKLMQLQRRINNLIGVDLTTTVQTMFPMRPRSDNTEAKISRGWYP